MLPLLLLLQLLLNVLITLASPRGSSLLDTDSMENTFPAMLSRWYEYGYTEREIDLVIADAGLCVTHLQLIGQ